VNADAWAIHYGHDLKTCTFDRGRAPDLAVHLHGTIHPMVYMESVMDPRSERNLNGVHPALEAVVRRAYEIVAGWNDGLGFVVTEGVRTRERQAELVKAKASWTMNSMHLPQADGMAHAVDLAATVGGSVRWDFPLYDRLDEAMKEAAKDQGVKIEWGGDWKKRDGPHWQLGDPIYSA
jgi:peptidoglycan L-alanyl-D-glutamate endopeptidase CwlK